VLDFAPAWFTGDFNSLAIRFTQHPVARELCQTLKPAVVSSSANISGQEPAKTLEALSSQLGDNIDYRLEGALGRSLKPSMIRDSVTGKIIRE